MAIPSKNVLGNPNVTEGNFQIAIEQLRESVIGSGKTYDSANTYMAYDICYYSGVVYYSKINNNTGNTPSIGANWGDYADLLSGVVHNKGDETVAGVKTFSSGIKLQNQNVSPFSGFKNYIINGNFDVWQRGTFFTGLTNGSYSADRWVVYSSVEDINYNVVRFAGEFTGGYGANYTWNSGTGQRSIIQFIENVTKFKVGTQVTISFEAYTTSTPYTVGVCIQGVRGTWAAVTGEVTSNIELTNTKKRYSVTLTVPDWTSLVIDWAHLEDTKLAVKFNFGTNTNGKNFIIGNVQLEDGSVATPFEQRPYGLELSLCQRYYRKWRYTGGAQNISTTQLQFTIDQIAYMRITPTLTNYASGSGSGVIYSTFGSSESTQYFGANRCVASIDGVITANVTGLITGVSSISIYGTASAEL